MDFKKGCLDCEKKSRFVYNLFRNKNVALKSPKLLNFSSQYLECKVNILKQIRIKRIG